MNVLILHQMGDPWYRIEAVRSLEYMIPENRPDLSCIVHDADLPFPEYLKSIEFNLIVLGPTFLCNRYSSFNLKKVLKSYDFIKHSNACKIALPQDDYDCSSLLDDWMVEWKIDRIYTVCPENWNVLYPKSSKNIQIKLGYTGYISDSWINLWQSPKLQQQREIDVSYRARKLPANFGSLGRLKWQIADLFLESVKDDSTLNLDISINPKDIISGDSWHSFIENSKFCLTTASGSSLLDPWNHIRHCVNSFLAKQPKATYQQIEEHCFSGLDKKYVFTAISPRNIEAALAETVQIATPGSYSGLMLPYEHFIPLEEDCSNINEVILMMNDSNLVNKIKKQCKESILSEPRLRQKYIVNEIISFAESEATRRNILIKEDKFQSVIKDKYEEEYKYKSDKYWRYKRSTKKIQSVAIFFGAKRFYNLIIPFFLKNRGI